MASNGNGSIVPKKDGDDEGDGGGERDLTGEITEQMASTSINNSSSSSNARRRCSKRGPESVVENGDNGGGDDNDGNNHNGNPPNNNKKQRTSGNRSKSADSGLRGRGKRGRGGHHRSSAATGKEEDREEENFDPLRHHLILTQADTFEQALLEFTRSVFFTDEGHGQGALGRPLQDLSRQIYKRQTPEEIRKLVDDYPDLRRLTILQVDHLPLEGLLALLSAYQETLKHLELFATPATARHYLDGRLLLQVLRMRRLAHLSLPFDLALINPSIPCFPLHVDVLQQHRKNNDGKVFRRQREFYGAAALYRPEAERMRESSLEELSTAKLYSMRKKQVKSLRLGHVLETALIGEVVLYGRGCPADRVDDRDGAPEAFPVNHRHQVVVEKLGLYLNSHLDYRHFQANGLPSLFNWSTLTSLDLDLPLHLPLSLFFRLIGGTGQFVNLVALRLADRRYWGGPRAYGHLFSDLDRRDLADQGAGITRKLLPGGLALDRLRHLTLARFYFGRLGRVVRGQRRFGALNIDLEAREARRTAVRYPKDDIRQAYDQGPFNYDTILEVVLPRMAPNVTSLHFEDCVLDHSGGHFTEDYLYRLLGCNWPALVNVYRDNVFMFSFFDATAEGGGDEKMTTTVPDVENQSPEVYQRGLAHVKEAMLANGWWKRRADHGRLLRVAHENSRVVELPPELWTEVEKEDRARGPLHHRGVFVAHREADRRALEVWGKKGDLPTKKTPLFGGADVLYRKKEEEVVMEVVGGGDNDNGPNPGPSSRPSDAVAAAGGRPTRSSSAAVASTSVVASTSASTSAPVPSGAASPSRVLSSSSATAMVVAVVAPIDGPSTSTSSAVEEEEDQEDQEEEDQQEGSGSSSRKKRALSPRVRDPKGRFVKGSRLAKRK